MDPNRPWQEDIAQLRRELWTQFGMELDKVRRTVDKMGPLVDDLIDIVYGNEKLGVTGIKKRLEAFEDKLDTLIEQRDRLIFLLKVALAIGGGTGGLNLLLELLRIAGVVK